MKKIPVIIRHIYSKFVIFVGFGIFYFEKLDKLGTFFRTAFGFGKNGFIAVQDKISLMNNMYLMIVAVICCFPILSGIKNISDKHFVTKATVTSAAAIASALILIVTSVMLVDATTNPFLYFRF